MELSGWGRYPVIQAEMMPAINYRVLQEKLTGKERLIAFGNGRSYGDSALANKVVAMRPLARMLDFDPLTGLLTCESGVLLSEIIDVFLPRGWFLKVTPGTKFITVGGAVAADIHGKNHHNAGCFGDTLAHLKLMDAHGEIITCSRDQNRELFCATCGGMGLTGMILEAAFYLTRVPSASILQTTIKTRNLGDTLAAFEQHAGSTYSVAWMDSMAKGDSLGRSLVMLGEFADISEHPGKYKIAAVPENGNPSETTVSLHGERKMGLFHQHRYFHPEKTISVPTWFPGFLMNNRSIGIFNKLYYIKAHSGVSQRSAGLDSFFYPLDRLSQWNRLYGKSGFVQYQFILPKSSGAEGLETMLQDITGSGMGSFLAVLKLHGPANDHYLSFPMEGYSLALDFKVQKGLTELLNRLDKRVLKYGGRIYLAKDARVSREVFEQGYPQIEMFRMLRKSLGLDRKFRSMQSDRLGL